MNSRGREPLPKIKTEVNNEIREKLTCTDMEE
jgi:hypothetical protein